MIRVRFNNGRIILPAGVAEAATIVIGTDGRIDSVDAPETGDSDEVIDLSGGWLAPGFIDTQVNGGGGVLFNDRIDVDGVAAIAVAHRAFGTTGLLPTLISDGIDEIAAALDAVDTAIAIGVPGVIGVHIEGPVLNAARKGIHDAARFRDFDDRMIDLLIRKRNGSVMVTLAPERVRIDTIRTLASAGVRISVGHSEASYDQTLAAFDAGVTGVTHLYNAMPPMRQREPGVVGAALDDPRPWCGLIVDRVHVAAPVLRIALKARPIDRMMLVTDAMPSVGTMSEDFMLQGRQIRVRDGICSYEDGTLAGSDLDMASAVANCVADLDLSGETALIMASTNPATFLGVTADRGVIAPGRRADLVQLDSEFAVVATWIEGACRRVATIN